MATSDSRLDAALPEWNQATTSPTAFSAPTELKLTQPAQPAIPAHDGKPAKAAKPAETYTIAYGNPTWTKEQTKAYFAQREASPIPIPSDENVEKIDRAAKKYGIDRNALLALFARESSSGRNLTPPPLKAGELPPEDPALGVMQQKSTYAKQHGIDNRLDPQQAFDGAAKGFKHFLELTDGDTRKAFIMYNQGPDGALHPRNAKAEAAGKAYGDWTMKAYNFYGEQDKRAQTVALARQEGQKTATSGVMQIPTGGQRAPKPNQTDSALAAGEAGAVAGWFSPEMLVAGGQALSKINQPYIKGAGVAMTEAGIALAGSNMARFGAALTQGLGSAVGQAGANKAKEHGEPAWKQEMLQMGLGMVVPGLAMAGAAQVKLGLTAIGGSVSRVIKTLIPNASPTARLKAADIEKMLDGNARDGMPEYDTYRALAKAVKQAAPPVNTELQRLKTTFENAQKGAQEAKTAAANILGTGGATTPEQQAQASALKLAHGQKEQDLVQARQSLAAAYTKQSDDWNALNIATGGKIRTAEAVGKVAEADLAKQIADPTVALHTQGQKLAELSDTGKGALSKATNAQYKADQQNLMAVVKQKEEAGDLLADRPQIQQLISRLQTKIGQGEDAKLQKAVGSGALADVTQPTLKGHLQTVLRGLMETADGVKPSFTAIDGVRRSMSDVAFLTKGSSGFNSQWVEEARRIGKVLDQELTAYAGDPASPHNPFRVMQENYKKGVDQLALFSSASGQKLIRGEDTTKALPLIEALYNDPAAMPKFFYRSDSSVKTLRLLTGDNAAVDKGAAQFLASELRGRSAQQVSEYLADPSVKLWMGQVPGLQDKAQVFAGGLRETEAKAAAVVEAQLQREAQQKTRSAMVGEAGDAHENVRQLFNSAKADDRKWAANAMVAEGGEALVMRTMQSQLGQLKTAEAVRQAWVERWYPTLKETPGISQERLLKLNTEVKKVLAVEKGTDAVTKTQRLIRAATSYGFQRSLVGAGRLGGIVDEPKN